MPFSEQRVSAQEMRNVGEKLVDMMMDAPGIIDVINRLARQLSDMSPEEVGKYYHLEETEFDLYNLAQESAMRRVLAEATIACGRLSTQTVAERGRVN